MNPVSATERPLQQGVPFLSTVLDSLTEHLAVIDDKGRIQYTNRAWNQFGADNDCRIKENWIGINYLGICDQAANQGDDFGVQAANGIRRVINGEPLFYFEYPCHSPNEQRWFMMRVTPFSSGQENYFVIAHQNITERKLAEEQVRNLARRDGLTGLYNRRHFDEFFEAEWRRCTRLDQPISLALFDIDHFKQFNDTYGHQAGDDCLRQVGQLMAGAVNRPSDLCARYGGEEFVLVLGNSPRRKAQPLVEGLIYGCRHLAIPNENAPTPIVTLSVGLASHYPTRGGTASELLRSADELLYRAKANGRNQVVC